MAILNGWKEIAAHLRLQVRTAQRWERLGLPVHRVSSSSRSPVVASSDELELWARRRRMKSEGRDETLVSARKDFQTRRRDLRRLFKQMQSLRAEHYIKLLRLRDLVSQQMCRIPQDKNRLVS
jgi:hypothetical protein